MARCWKGKESARDESNPKALPRAQTRARESLRSHTSPRILQPAEPARPLKIFGIIYLTNQPHRASKKPRAREKLSLHPLSLEEALRGAMETGPPPESSRKRCKAKRSKTERRVEGSLVVSFWVFESWHLNKAVVHRGECPSCQQGRGVHGVTVRRNSQWLGPYATRKQAFEKAHKTGRDDVRGCKRCSA